jgi:hypothetical protein
LFLGGGALATLSTFSAIRIAQARPPALSEPLDIDVRATPIDHFLVSDRDRRRFGSLTFRSGLELRSDFNGFGGLSGLWRSPSGEELVGVTDNAHWLVAKVASSEGRLAGLRDVTVAPMLAGNGRPLRRTRSYDTEGLTIAGGVAYVSIERTQEVMRFNWARDGVRSRGQPVPVPAEAKGLPRNAGLEAIGLAPARSPLGGALVVIAERAEKEDSLPTRGFILSGSKRGAFAVTRSRDYDVTDLAFLSSGEMLLLERRFSVLQGPGARIRRIAATAIAPGATIDGEVIFEADAGHQIDNMEGMAVHRGQSGETIVSLISDDNFSTLQRTILLEFTLEG